MSFGIAFKRLLGILLVTLLFTAVGLPTEGIAKEKPLLRQVKEMNRLVDLEQWDQALKKAQAAEQTYKKNRWKLQFLGNEREYEGLDQEYAKLLEAIKEKEKAQVKMQLAVIQEILKDIYSM